MVGMKKPHDNTSKNHDVRKAITYLRICAHVRGAKGDQRGMRIQAKRAKGHVARGGPAILSR